MFEPPNLSPELATSPAEHAGSGAGRSVPVPLEPALVIPDLPPGYDDDRVVLLVRDPNTLYVYWDFHPDTVRTAYADALAGRPVVRVLLLGGSEPVVFRDVDVDLRAGAWFIPECEPNRDYRVMLMLLGPGDVERQLGRSSNLASLPPDAPSTWVEDRFASIPLDVPLPTAGLFVRGRAQDTPGERRLHRRAFELSGGEAAEARGGAGSSDLSGLGGRPWSGTGVRK